MNNFKHHKYFPKEKHSHSYLFPHVCFHCRKSFKKPRSTECRLCPQCGETMIALSRKFSAPRSTDIEQWKKIQYLVSHGFLFQSIYEHREDGGRYRVSYPQTLEESKEFVVKFKEQAAKSRF